ncbi:MAG: pantoate kinase [archaeon GB-1867-035]|nr:pantoate kinase [Candidatus Culexmicrobium profundum]
MHVEVFSPSAISSFFASHIVKDPLKCGAYGGGFTINRGVYVSLEVDFNVDEIMIENYINNVKIDSFILRKIIDLILPKDLGPYKIVVRQRIEVPIECGFGTSGASALALSFALAKAFNLKMTYLQIARIAHMADLECKTGLGTVAGIIAGGFRLALKPGAPGIGVVDRIPICEDEYFIIAAAFGSISTRNVLSSRQKLKYINKLGKQTLRDILKDVSPENFMKCCKIFAFKSGFMTSRVKKVIEAVEKAGAIGATQNMIGEAVHALVDKNNFDSVFNAFKRFFNEENIIVAKLDVVGPRYISSSNH